MDMCTTEPLADMLTKRAFKNIQWKSSLRLFDVLAPPKLRCPSQHGLQLTARLRELTPWDEKPEEPSYGWCETRSVLRPKKARTCVVLARHLPRGNTHDTKEAYIEAMWERDSELRLSTRPSRCRAAEKHLNDRSDGVQLPESAVHLGYPRRQSGGEPLCSKTQTSSHSGKDCNTVSPMDSILSNIHWARVYVFPTQ